MSKLPLTATVAMIGLVGCTSQKPAAQPEDGTTGIKVEDQTEEVAETEADEAPAEESDETVAQAQEETATEEASPASSTGTDRGSSRPTCAGREQKLCEVTVGCAWSTTKECLSQ